MNRRQFLGDDLVRGFLDYFAAILPEWTVEYYSEYRRIRPAERHFRAHGIEEALNQYAWPATFDAPEAIAGFPFARDACVEGLYGWNSTRVALEYLQAGLLDAVEAGDDARTLRWCRAVLVWGLGPGRSSNPYQQLTMIGSNGRGVSEYLKAVQQLTALKHVDTEDITSKTVPYACAGLAKIHSLASGGELVILDSRVAAALGECINEYLRAVANSETIPAVLRIPRSTQLARVPTPVGRGISGNHPTFSRDYRWIKAQIRVSWLLTEVIDLCPQIFQGCDKTLRVHMLEAALFMMGAKVGRQHHQFPRDIEKRCGARLSPN